MADNIDLDSGTGGATVKTDDDGTAHWQYVKVAFGADNTQTRVTSSVGMPVDLLAGTAEIGNVKNAGTFATQATLQAGTAEVGKLAAGVAEIGNVKNSGTFAVQATTTNAGTFVVQEDGAALTALQVIDNGVYVDDADWTALTSSHYLFGGIYQSSPGSITDGDTGPVRLSVNGAMHIHDGGNSITVDGTVTANPASGTIDTVTTVGTVTNLAQMNGAAITMGNGASGTGVQRVTIASDTTGVLSIDDNGGSLTVDNGGTFATQAVCTNAGTFAVQSTLQAGTAAFGKLSANDGVDIGDVDVTSISAGSNLVGDVGLSGARTSGGTTMYRNIDVDETEDAVKASAGQLYFIQCTNIDATPIYLHFYNAGTGSVTVGSTTPDLTFLVPSQGDANGAGFVLSIPNGIAFSTAITVAATTTVGGSSGPAANEVLLNIGFA